MAGHSRPKDGVASARLCPAINAYPLKESKTWIAGSRLRYSSAGQSSTLGRRSLGEGGKPGDDGWAYPSPSSLAKSPFTARAQPASLRSRVALLMAGLKRRSSRQLSANFDGSG